jgi:hypothetical protein
MLSSLGMAQRERRDPPFKRADQVSSAGTLSGMVTVVSRMQEIAHSMALNVCL